MGTGPKATAGFDLSLTEVIDSERHYFLVHAGSARGEEIVNDLTLQKAQQLQLQTEQDLIDNSAKNMGRRMDTEGIKELLYANAEHPRWENVAERCLTCANCTMACPTCFCSTVEDVTDLTGDHVERWRKWDSCFTEEGRFEVENQYARSVNRQGNEHARKIIEQVFCVIPRQWRGIGTIAESGFGLSPDYARFDAERRFELTDIHAQENPQCISGLILQGLRKPSQCPAFGKICTPEQPLGATMVSSEGACAAYYRYRKPALAAEIKGSHG
jgi:ferredoxin